MKYVEISEPVFRDLIGCKSKLEDIKVLLAGNKNLHKKTLVDELMLIVYSSRYQDKGE